VVVPDGSQWDVNLVLASLRRTSRLAVLHDAERRTAAAEILATVAELGFEYLDAPLRRIDDGPGAERALVDLAEF
jgi:pyruvate/2-oxoglutarate/acetoin dehydrogenase E1 component